MYQLSTRTTSSTSIIAQKTQITAVALCYYITSSYVVLSFLHKVIVHKYVLVPLSKMISIYMHMWTCGTHTMVTETSKTTNF